MAEPVWTLSIILAVVVGGLLLLWGLHIRSGSRGPSKSGARLPKGSLGWPFIGETLAFATNPVTYASSRAQRYGKIFKSSLFGRPVIFGLTPEFTKFINSNNKDLFVSGYPPSLLRLLGSNALLFLDGPLHMSLKKILQKPFLSDALRSKVNTLETIVLENMASWEQRGNVNGRTVVRKGHPANATVLMPNLRVGYGQITQDTGIWLLLGLRDIGSTPEGKKLMENLEHIGEAQFSVPVNLPGTAYNKGLKAKAALTEHFKHLVTKRKEQANSQADVLEVLLAAQDDPQAQEEVKNLDVDIIARNIVFLWFAAYDTTSTTLVWILKLLIENPAVFQRVQAEQQEILKSKHPSARGPRLSWEDTRKMAYTQKFLQEVQRYRSVTNIQLRRATQDIEYEGHLLPKGWVVGWIQAFTHLDPDVFPEPESFNPDRFNATPKGYLPFGAGPHMCPGIETVKLISLIFIHHLTTTYIYESTAPDKGVEYNSFPTPKGGYPINIRRMN